MYSVGVTTMSPGS